LPSWFGDHIAAAREGSPGDALEWDQYQQRLSPISAQSRRIYEHRHKALLSYRTAGGKLTLLTSKTRQRDNAVSAACSSSRCWSSESRRS
jgi:hypothetical protein